MKASAYILLIIGILGIIASIINYLAGESMTSSLLSLLCSMALVFGYSEIKRLSKSR